MIYQSSSFFIGPVFTKIPKITHLEKLFHIGLATTFFNRLHCGRILNISYYTPRMENAHKSSSFQVLWCVDESFSQSDSQSGSSFMHICKCNTIFSSLIYKILIYFDIWRALCITCFAADWIIFDDPFLQDVQRNHDFNA